MPSASRSVDLVRFGVFELDRRSGELRKAGARISLQEQGLQVLTLLLERPGDLVTRDELRQRLWPTGTFGDFDHGLNAVINRLRDTLGDSADTPRLIETLPRRGYRFIGSIDRPDAGGASGQSVPASALLTNRPARRPFWLRILVGAVAVAGVLAGAAWLVRRDGAVVGSAMRVVPLTTLRGHETWPTFSPDGSHVAFAWGGEKDDNPDIYIATVGRPEVRRLTSDPQADSAPSWSPDGRQLAYVRALPGTAPFDIHSSLRGLVHLMSPLGGDDRRLNDAPVAPPLAWAPDGRHLAARYWPAAGRAGERGIYLFAVTGDEPRALTRPARGVSHSAPAFSPSGRQLAYASCIGAWCEIEVLDLDDGLVPKPPPRRVTHHRLAMWGLNSTAWTRDGRSIVYSSWDGEAYLWSVRADGSHAPERLEAAGLGAIMPTVAASTNQIVFARSLYDVDIFEFRPGSPAVRVVGSTFIELGPAVSPDGRRLAFSSARSGQSTHIWIANRDGSDIRQLTHGPGVFQGSPRWSPDASRIAFDSFGEAGVWKVWVIDADGGTPQPITNIKSEQVVPSWSRDGRWINFAAGEWDPYSFAIWRVPSSGGPAQRMTSDGTGRFASETADGTRLVYQAADADSALMIVPVGGGSSRQLVPCARNAAFGVGAQGVYYVPCETGTHPPLRLLDLNSGEDRLLGRLEQFDQSMDSLGLAISPDGLSILYPRNVNDSADLMLIENVR
jgi:Tol biopolymer transport system component/DNA-binding winged helix-turn-helix (wHTH) protein